MLEKPWAYHKCASIYHLSFNLDHLSATLVIPISVWLQKFSNL